MRLVLIFTTLVVSALMAIQSNEASTKIKVPTVDGFDYPVARPNASGYYKSRGWSKRHPGEDWVGAAKGPNGSSLLGAPVYTIGAGRVVFARNASGSWGNVVIIRHAYHVSGKLHFVDSFYAHLHRVLVREGQIVVKGEQVGEIGTNRGMYSPHLHFEIRKNLSIGTCRSNYARSLDNYYVPTAFIEAHRKIRRHGQHVRMLAAFFSLQNALPSPIDESRYAHIARGGKKIERKVNNKIIQKL